MNSERCLRYLGGENRMKRRKGTGTGVDWMICICLSGWWLALFPCHVRVKRKLCVAVGSCRCLQELPAREWILGALSSNWQRPTDARRGGEDPYQRCRRIIHITCRCVIFFLLCISPCLGRFLNLDGFFEVSGHPVSPTALQEQSGQWVVSSTSSSKRHIAGTVERSYRQQLRCSRHVVSLRQTLHVFSFTRLPPTLSPRWKDSWKSNMLIVYVHALGHWRLLPQLVFLPF
jgi:hypothetical protein